MKRTKGYGSQDVNVNISDMVIVITGASRGLGSALAKAFAKEQSKVVINYNESNEKACKLFEEIRSFNKKCMLIKADVTKQSDVINMHHRVIEKYGYIDVLINNAGVCDDNLIDLMSLEQWNNVIDVDLTGLFLCCHEISKTLKNQKFGKIINIASLKGQEGSGAQVNYSVAKAGVIALTKSLAKEMGEYNIAVNAVCPGFIVTDLNRNNPTKRKKAERESLLSIDSAIDDFVNFMIFLSSDRVRGVSGRIYNVDSRIHG